MASGLLIGDADRWARAMPTDDAGSVVYRYIQLLRLKRAGYALAFRERRVLDVALDQPIATAHAHEEIFV